MDLLAEHGPVESYEAIRLDDGVGAIRRTPQRARRPRPEHDWLFDAVEIFRSEEDLPPSEMRLTTLIKTTFAALQEPPPNDAKEREERHERIAVLLAQIDERSINSERFMATAGAETVALTLTRMIAIPLLAALSDKGEAKEADSLIAEFEPENEALKAWSTLLLPAAGSELALDDVGKIWERSGKAVAYFSTAGFEDVIDWHAPPSLPEGERPPRDDQIRWIIDRFTRTYLAEWSTASLYLEWKYLHAKILGPCDSKSMVERHVNEDALAKAIATDATDRHDMEKKGISTHEHVAKAVEMIRGGRRSGAAAIFESISKLQPHDEDALNNWGFCLLPDDPAKALDLLQRAADLGSSDSPVNVANRVLCLACVDRPASALSLAERYWNEGVKPALTSAFLWSFEDRSQGDFELLDIHDVDGYIADLAAEIAVAAGDQTLAAQWRTRRLETTPSKPT